MSSSLLLAGCEGCKIRAACILDAIERPYRDRLPLVLQQIRYAPGDLIFSQGTPSVGCYLICRGAVKEVWRTAEGDNQVIRLASVGHLVGIEALALPFYHTYIESLAETLATFIEKQTASWLYQECPSFSTYIIRELIHENSRLERQWVDATHQGIKQRLKSVLYGLGKQWGQREGTGFVIALKLRRWDFAEMLGCSPVMTYRLLKELEQRGIMTFQNGNLYIRNMDALGSDAYETPTGYGSMQWGS